MVTMGVMEEEREGGKYLSERPRGCYILGLTRVTSLL